MKTIFIYLVLISLFSVVGCKKDKCDDYFIVYGTVHSVSSPDTISTGKNTIIDVSYHTSNGCQSFESFEEVKDGYNWKININIENDPCDNFCFQAALPKSTTYQFRTELAGTYILDFGKNGILDTIIVQ
ncbi:MAG: hypothetical protein AB8B74_14900 [Crocinitomicaceae bacterium]